MLFTLALMKPRLFISHPWAANTHHFASRLVDELSGRGYGVWIDEQQMMPGQQIAGRQTVGIQSETDIFLFTLSHASLASANCITELKTAAAIGKPMIAIRLEPVPAPAEIASRIEVDFANPVYFTSSVERLCQGCDALFPVVLVIRALDDDDPEKRCEAARLLRDMNASDSLGTVLAHARRECDHVVLYWMLVAAGSLATLRPDLAPQVVGFLEQYACSNSAMAQRGAREGLAALGVTN